MDGWHDFKTHIFTHKTAKEPESSMTAGTSSNRNGVWTLQRATSSEDQLQSDQRVVRDYVKNKIFEMVVFVWSQKSLNPGGVLHKAYLKDCRHLLSGGKLMSVSDADANAYMNILWRNMMKDGCYKVWLGQRRSNTYQAMQDRFESKFSTDSKHVLCVLKCGILTEIDPLFCRCYHHLPLGKLSTRVVR